MFRLKYLCFRTTEEEEFGTLREALERAAGLLDVDPESGVTYGIPDTLETMDGVTIIAGDDLCDAYWDGVDAVLERLA